ncbi:DEAD/DEAH box helicase [Kineosporia sp. A_224]|uniref:DEAD/DEAH box helicase n=1 Tax=Kineosporia sp. A_224 TaxID=1962180 RepID=UPI000B4ABD2B|nr:DEAD/DEAH box helicase [Kineosporia sp. A_224]
MTQPSQGRTRTPARPRTNQSSSNGSYGKSSYSTGSYGSGSGSYGSSYGSGSGGSSSYGSPRRSGGPGRGRRPNGGTTPRQVREPAKTALDIALDEALAAPAPEPRTFAQLGLPEVLVTALSRRGMAEPFAIQARALPDAIAGRDVLGRAQTGSGKTLAFGLPMLARLADPAIVDAPTGKGVDSARHTGRRTPHRPRGLVLVPTRELALQVADALSPLANPLGLRVTTVFGGSSYKRQIDALTRGVDIVIATPGRLVDLIDRRVCNLADVEITVLDEADYMADLGFLPVVTNLLGMTREGGQRLLFSATLDRGVGTLVEKFLTNFAVHAVAPVSSPVEAMDHKVFTVGRNDKLAVAAEVAGRPGRTLFFVRTKHGADRLATQLTRSGVEAAAIHGNLGQGARQRALAAFSDGSTRVLVATDVAARGIHVDDVDLVVHFDPPNDHKDYLHRSGRTARAGASGTVVALVLPEESRAVEQIHRAAKVEPVVTSVAPGHPAVVEVATSGEPVVVKPRAAERERPAGRRPGSGPRRTGGYQGSSDRSTGGYRGGPRRTA